MIWRWKQLMNMLMLMVDEKEKMAIVSYDNGWSCKNELEWRWAEIDRVRRGWGIGSLCSDGSIILTWGSGRSAQWAARTIVPISGAGYCRHEVRFPAVNASEHKVLWCVNDIFCNCGFGFCFGFVFLFFDLYFVFLVVHSIKKKFAWTWAQKWLYYTNAKCIIE